MIIFRRLLTQVIRNGQLQVRDIVKAQEDEFLQLSPVMVKKVAQEFYLNFEDLDEFRKTNKFVISRVKSVLHQTSSNNQLALLKALAIASDKGAEVDCEVIFKGLEILTRNTQVGPAELSLISRFVHLAYSKNLDCDLLLNDFFQNIRPELIESCSEEFLNQLAKILESRASFNKFFNVFYPGSGSIYEILENEVQKRFESLPIPSLMTYFKMFISCDQGNEDFIRKLETKVFGNLAETHEKHLVELVSFNKSRYLHNCSYMTESISKPLYLEFTSRFESLNPLTKSLFLLNYWKNSKLYGMFTDGQLQLKLETFFKNKENFKNLDVKTRNFLLLNSFTYLAHARQLNNPILKAFEGLYSDFFPSFDSLFNLRLLTCWSREESFPESIFSRSLETFPALRLSSETSSQIYSIYLNLKYRHPSKLEAFLKSLPKGETLENIEKNWKNFRINDLVQTRGSHLHRGIEDLLRQKQVSFISEFYDDYFIDLVIPELKIAVEISGPGHFLHPSLILNGRSYNKQEILKAKGWKVHSFAYYSSKSLPLFISSILPLDF